jgi:hypothetical protein
MKIDVKQITFIVEKAITELNIKKNKTYKYDEHYSCIKIDENREDMYIDINSKEIIITYKKGVFEIFTSEMLFLECIATERELVVELKKIITMCFVDYIIDENFCQFKHDIEFITDLIIRYLNKFKVNNIVTSKNKISNCIIINNKQNQFVEINNNSIVIHKKCFMGFSKHNVICINEINNEIILEKRTQQYIAKNNPSQHKQVNDSRKRNKNFYFEIGWWRGKDGYYWFRMAFIICDKKRHLDLLRGPKIACNEIKGGV